MRWPPPPPGRPELAWLLALPPRGWILRRLLRLPAAGLADGAWVVSVGGGPGYEFDQVERLREGRRWRFVLLDAQRPMLGHAAARAGRRRAPAPEPLLGDAAELPFPPNSVDLLLSLGVLCCLTDEGAELAVQEAERVVRPGGFLALAVPRWRGRVDDDRHLRAGFRRVGGTRPGRSIFSKSS